VSRFNKVLDSRVLVPSKTFPVTISFTTSLGVLYTDSDRYVTIIPVWYLIDWEPLNIKGIKSYPLISEPCKREHVSMYEEIFLQDSFFNSSFCINQTAFYNGTQLQKADIFIQNEYSSLNSSLIQYIVAPCFNSTLNGNKCAPQADIDKFLVNVNIAYSYLDSYVNLDNYEKPYTYFLNRNIVALNRKIGKSNFIKVKTATIQTDSGFVLEDKAELSILQCDPIFMDILGETTVLFNLMTVGSKIQDTYVRRYIKVQDIVANVGGLLKSLLMIGSLLLTYFQERSFKFEIINNLYRLSDVVKTDLGGIESRVQIVNELKDNTNNQIDITRNNFTPPKEKFKDLQLSFFDYICSKKCRSKYPHLQYKYLIKFIDEKFEVLNYIRTTNTLDSLVGLLLNNPQRQKLQEKHGLTWSKEGVQSFNFKDNDDIK
jgi:hypothetical protein